MLLIITRDSRNYSNKSIMDFEQLNYKLDPDGKQLKHKLKNVIKKNVKV